MNNVLFWSGITSGIATGLLGIGVGVILVPMLTYLANISIHEAIATSLVVQLLPETIFGVMVYQKAGHVKWYRSLFVMLGSIIGIFVGSIIANMTVISDKLLKQIFTVVMALITGYMVYTNF